MTPDAGPSEAEHNILDRQRTLGPIEEFARGEVRSYHGIVNGWLLVVYAILAVWSVYYVVRYWGGLGPGLPQ